jgi:hypothetical protein
MPRLLSDKIELKANFAALEVNAEFGGFKSFIDDAEDTLAEIVGYHVINGLAEAKDSTDPVVKRAVTAMSRAVAHLGIYIWSKTAMYKISEGVLMLVKSEKGAIISDKKLQDLHGYCQDTGYKFLDKAIALMEANLAKFPLWAQSDERLRSRQYFIQTAGDFSAFHSIGESRITYQSLMPIMADVEERFLPVYMGEEYYLTFKELYVEEMASADDKKLLPYIKKAIALITVSDSFNRLPVQLKAGGLFIDSFTSTTEYEQKLSPDQKEKDRLRGYYFNLGESTLLKLRQYLNKNASLYPEYTPAAPGLASINTKESGVYGMF